MKKTLRFSILSMLLMMCGAVSAQELTFDFNNDIANLFPTITEYSSGSGANYNPAGEFNETTTSTSIEGVTVTVTASDADASTRNRIWATNPRLRLYDGSITFSSVGNKIVSIELTRTTNKNLIANQNTADSGTLTTTDQQSNGVVTWTGNAQSVTINIAGNTQLSKAVVTLDDGNVPVLSAPVISPNGGTFSEPVTVTMTQSEDAQIQYTINYSNDIQTYTEPFVVSETSTVTAWAVDVTGATSNSVSATFTIEKMTECANIGEFNALESGTEAKLLFDEADEVQVVFANKYEERNRDYVVLQDKNKNRIVLFNTGAADVLKANDVLTGYIVGKNSPYNGMAEMAKTSNTDLSTIVAIEGTAIKVDVLSSVAAAMDPMKLLKLCQVKKVTLRYDGNRAYAEDAEGSLQIYNAFGVTYELPELEDGQTLNITGIIVPYQRNADSDMVYEICPISQEAIEVVYPPYYQMFETTTVLIPTAEAVAEGSEGETAWIEGGTTRTDNKRLYVDPYTDEAKETKNAPGVGLKFGNASKTFAVRVTGIDGLWAYGASAKAGTTRILRVRATDEDGYQTVEQGETDGNTVTVKVADLSSDSKYYVTFEGYDDGGQTGADVVLHAVKFIVGDQTTVGINDVEARAAVTAEAIYNLAGQKVSATQKGLYIIGGKKFVK